MSDGLIVRRGGGTALNFKVVGGIAQPPNPKENTIWVNTNAEIPNWIISGEDPLKYNLLDYEKWKNVPLGGGGTCVFENNGVSITPDSNGWAFINLTGDQALKIQCQPGKTYTLSWDHSGADGLVILYPNAEQTGEIYWPANKNKLDYTAGEGVTCFTFGPVGNTANQTTYFRNFYIQENQNPAVRNGTVWISTGTSSPAKFNALKKNAVMVYPFAAKQYIDGEWMSVTAEIWNGQWRQISAVTLIYDAGTTYVPLTLTSADAKEEYISVTLASSGKAYITTTTKLDITAHMVASVTYSNLSGGSTGKDCYIKLMVLNGSGEEVASTTATNTASGTITLDITSLSGEHTIQVYCYNTSGSASGSCRISKIHLSL